MKNTLPIIITVIITSVIIVGGYFAFKLVRESGSTVISENVSEEEKKAKEAEERKAEQDLLFEKLEVLFQQKSPGTTFSLSIYDLNHNEYFGLDDTEAQHAASVSKVLTAVYTYHLAQEGKISLSDTLGAYNVETQIKFMVNVSNPPSWEMIDDLVGRKSQNKYAKSIGLKSVNLTKGVNKMSPKDATMLLVKLAKGELISKQNRTKLFSYMQNTESEDLLSPGFPKGTIFYHKTGKYLGEAHDNAYVAHEKNPFILTVFSDNNSTKGGGQRKVMPLVAQEVYNYFDAL